MVSAFLGKYYIRNHCVAIDKVSAEIFSFQAVCLCLFRLCRNFYGFFLYFQSVLPRQFFSHLSIW